MSTSPAHVRNRPALAVTLVALVAGTVTTLTAWSPDRAAGDPPGVVVVDEDFSSRQAAALFSTSGPGAWLVEDGAYLLTTAQRAGLRGPSRTPLSVLRSTVRSTEWKMATTVRTRRATGGEFSVVFAHRNRANFSYVHLDRDASLSGIYRARRGHTTRLAPLDAAATPGRRQVVELRRNGARLKVYVGAAGASSVPYVGGVTDLAGSPYLHAGFGSWGASVRIDELTVTIPGDATTTAGVPTGTATIHSSGTASPSGTISASSTPTTSGTPTATASPTTTISPTTTSSPTATPPPGGHHVPVSTSAQLTAALAGALPGDVITMADGVYTTKGLAAALQIGDKHYYGTFVLERSGTAAAPIVLQGSRQAIIDGKPGEVGTGTQYGLYLADADHVTVSGITVTNVTKGIVLDHSSHDLITGVEVHTTGQEGIHLRTFSSDNIVSGNLVHDTGTKNETYGEGLYVGSANSNWGTYSGGAPDTSDRNQLVGNTIYRTGAENMDIKEGTTGGLISGNTFDGAHMTGSWADSWIDLKGNGWMVENNHGTNALEDGFQVHQALSGWGNGNIFRSNVAAVNGPGYGFWLQNGITGTKVLCSNTVTGAVSGFANVPCSSA